MVLTHSFEDLAQTYRVLIEAYFSLNKLISVDRAEAIGTIETAINAKLNAFHSLYDLMAKELGSPVDWYQTPQLCTILAIRNARHHNKANRIRSLYNYHRYEAEHPTKAAEYFYVDFPAPPDEEGGDCFDVPLSWSDLDLFLSMPRDESRLRPEARSLVRAYLNADRFEANAIAEGVPKDKIFINFVPLSLNAGIALYSFVHPHVSPDSGEARTFLEHFKTTGAAMTKNHESEKILFALPQCD